MKRSLKKPRNDIVDKDLLVRELASFSLAKRLVFTLRIINHHKVHQQHIKSVAILDSLASAVPRKAIEEIG